MNRLAGSAGPTVAIIIPDPMVATTHSINTAVIGLPMRTPNPAFMAAMTGMPAPATHNKATIPKGVCVISFLGFNRSFVGIASAHP